MTLELRRRPEFLALAGPTASGKTALSLALSRLMEMEVVSMDSRQIYRGMDVGTGKASPAERAQVPHHGLDIRTPDQRYSAGSFSRDARGWIAQIWERGRVPVLVGGTGFFLKALTDPMFAEPRLDPQRLDRLRGYLGSLPMETLEGFVTYLDPESEEGIRGGGRHRATRRVEMALLTGRPLSWWHREGTPSEEPLTGLIVVLDWPREALYHRINARVRRMVEEEGLLDEVQDLLDQGYGPEDPGMTGAGYREALAYLAGGMDYETMVQEIQRSHRRYARRQLTWFRHQLPDDALTLDATRPVEELAQEVLSLWKYRSGRGREADGHAKLGEGEGDDVGEAYEVRGRSEMRTEEKGKGMAP